MDGLNEGQGSPESPSVANDTISDITAHLNRGEMSAEGSNTQTAQPVAQVSQEGQPAQEGQQPAPDEQRSRSEERIQQLLAEKQAAEQRAMQYEMFIVSNPEARAAYEKAIYQGYTPEQAAQMAAQPQYQQHQPQFQPQADKPWYGDVLTQEQLPEWDPFDENATREHAKVLVHDMVQAGIQQAIAPIMQQLQQVVPFVQQSQQQQLETQRQSMVSTLDEALFNAFPSAKENQAHFAIANQAVVEGIQSLPPQYQNAIRNFDNLHPQDKMAVNQALNQVVQQAAKRANELIGQLTPTQTQQQAMASQSRPFAESATNLVPARPVGEGSLQDMLVAHLNRNQS